MRTSSFFCLFLCLLVSACKKETYPKDSIQTNTQEIQFDGVLDGQPLSFGIGTSNYYCYSSFEQSSDSVYLATSSLRTYACTTCTNALTVSLSDVQGRAAGAGFPASEMFASGARTFAGGNSVTRTLQFKCMSNRTISTCSWQKNAEAFSSALTATTDISRPGLHEISASAKSTEGCSNTVKNKITITKMGELFACSINYPSGNGNALSFSATILGGKAPYHYTWKFGDGAETSASAPTHSYQYIGSYPITLIITDANNNRCEANGVVQTVSDLSSCSLLMDLSDLGSTLTKYKLAHISWTSQDNETFWSDSCDQSSHSFFEIVTTKDFETNENGHPTQLVHLKFNARLSNGKKTIQISSSSCSLAFAFKP